MRRRPGLIGADHIPKRGGGSSLSVGRDGAAPREAATIAAGVPRRPRGERSSVAAPSSESRRRIPKQARSRERLGRILDATRRELQTRPVADVTIEAIAERAGVPVGSLYQYFPSKSALLAAAAETVMDESDAQTSRQLAECRDLPWREVVDRVVSTTLGFLRDSPDYHALLRTIRFTAEFAQVTAASNERVADLMSLHPAFGRAGIPRAKALQICRTLVTAVNALQDRALADELLDFDALVEEATRLAKGYLGSYLP
jgi:AcrR family transcriptional regulator